ncbi:sensor histidine kinase [Burkholderia gladioli]|uniref:sensor histidine kinase n=1 Tax=Burkholderia gladioli TaxID=28095 RepID=UPI003EE1563B
MRGFDAAVANARGDRVQIQQVLINLLTNAIDAMPGGPERQAVITVATERLATGCLRVSVIDAGVGLQRDGAQRIFEPFYTTKAEGMGMGLAICRSIMEAHGGTLGAEPNPAGGTIMRFTVPAA